MPRRSVPVVAYPEYLQRCPQCEIWFAPNPKLKRPPIYCSASCTNAAYGKRSGRRPGRDDDDDDKVVRLGG